MKNAEKYVDQIARLIVSDSGEGICTCFTSQISQWDGSILCDTCILYKNCNDVERIKKWLLEEAKE